MSQSDLPDFSSFAVGGDDFAAPDFSSGAIAPESPALPMLPIPQKYIDGIKGFEGFTPKAKWDYKQHTNGFGTRAQPGEEIDEETANVRLHDEIGKAANIVDKFAPGLPSGVRAALTSLTFNSGDKWTRMGLGAAIRDGDMEEAGRRFNQYVKAGDETLPGLVERRAKEYQWWFDQDGDGENDAAPESSALADLLQAPPEKRRDILLSEMERVSGADLSAQRGATAQPKESAALDFSAFAVTPAAPKTETDKPLGIAEELSRALERGMTSFGQQAYGHKAMNTIEEIKRIQSVEDRIAKGDKNFTDERDIGYAALLPAERQKLIQNYTASLEDAIKGVAERGPKIAAIPPSPEIEKALNAKSFGEFWNTFKKSPLRFIATVGTESLPQMAPGLAGAIPGGMIAGPAGAAGALGAGSFLTDFSNQVISGLADEGVDVKDPAELEKAFKDPALMSKLKERAGLHAAAVGAFDAISGGVASKTLLPAKTFAKKPIAREAANVAVQLPVQGTLGAAGEVAGSVASGQEVQPGQVGAEFFGEFIGAPAEVAGIRSAAAASKAEEAAKAEPQKLLTETKKLPPPSTGTPPPVPRPPAAVAPDDTALLKQRGWSDADISEMGEEERADAIAEARDQVGKDAARAPDTPSAEPVSDLTAQIAAMRAGERKGVYLSPDNLANIQSNPDFVARISEALNESKGAEIVENVDGKGGILVAGSPEIAKKVKASIKSGGDTQAVLGDVTGAGQGKPADAAAVVQQKTPDGAVVRESAVSAADVAKTEQEFAAPGKTVETVTPEQAIARRDEAIAAEKAATFTTAKGSTYSVEPDGTTVRNKALRNDPGHEGDQGIKPKSDKTVYLSAEDAKRLAPPDSAKWRVVDHGDGTVSLATQNANGKWGIAPSAKNVPVSATPSVGATPLELWGKESIYGKDAYKTAHFGNDIVSVGPAQQGDGTRASPVAVKSAEDVARAGAVVASEPTEKQAEAGNYQKAHIRFQGIPISIETPKGGTRRGVKDGVTQWEVPDMPAAYGYVRGSTGADGEQIDVFIGDNVDSDSVFVVDQIDAETGKFDEHKAVLGANSPSEAAELYANSFSDGRGMARIGGMSEMTVAEFKTWARDGVQKAPLDAEPVNFEVADFSDQATPRSRTIERPERPDRYEGEPLEPAEIDAIVDSWRYVQDVMRRGRPQSLAAFVIENGGLRDDAREVRHIAGSAKERPGLVNKNGVDLDDAALSAWESGFFAGSERPTIAEFLDALQDDLATGNVLRDADQPLLEDLRIAEDIAQEIADYGVTTNRFRSEASLREYFGQERPRAAAKTEGDEKAQAPAKGRAGEAGADLVGDTFDLPEKGKTDKAFDPFAFSVQVAYAKTGADGLRKKLADLSSDQLKQIVSAQNLPVSDDVIARGNKKPLVDAIIEAAKSKLANRAAAGGGTVEGITGAKPKALPEEVWGPKFQKLMSSEYRTAVAGEDLSTQYDILTAKYNNAPNDPADMRAAMKAEIERLERELGPEWMAKYGGKAEAKPEPKTDWDFEPNAGWRDHLIRARVYATGLGINHKGMELPEIVEAIDRKLSDHQGVPEGVTVRLSDYTLDEPEASQKGGQYKAIAERKSPWSVEDGYGSTPAEARANALQRLLKKVQPQTSLVPEATTKEKIAAEAKSKEKRGSNEPMDVGMFGSEKDQTDLVDMAKQEKPEPIPTEEDEGPDFSGKPEDVRAIVDFHTQRQGGAVEFLKKNVRADSTVGEINALLSSSRAWGPAMSVSWSGDVPGAFGSSNRSSVLEITIRKNGEPDRIELQGKELADHIKALYAPQAGEQSASGLDAIRDRLLGDGFEGIVEARKFAKENGVDGTNKEIDEAIETAVVAAARERIEQRQNNAAKVFEIYRSLVKLYDNQPNLAVRTSTSVTNQAYSTPMPLAYLASRLAGVRGADVVYEPTAGNGALLIEAGPTNDEVYANEIDPKRAEALKALGFTVSQDDAATSGEIEQKADAIVANPPFGAVRENGQSKTWTVDGLTTTAIDHAIALNALHSMTDDGKAVLILGGIKAESVEERRAGYRGQSKRKFFAKLYKTYNVVDHFTVSGELYKKQGAGWPVDVVVIEGRGASSRVLPAAEPPQIFTSWDELEGKLPDANAAPGYKKEAVGRRGQDDKTARGKPEPESRDGNRSEAPVQRGPERLPAGTKDDAVSVQRDSDRGKSGDVRPDSNNARPDASKRDRDSGRADKPAAPRREPVVRKEPPKGSGQALYEPTSSAQSLDTLVPTNMASATKAALSRVDRRQGGLDAFVADRLAYSDALSNYFSAEQVDAVAAAIDNIERGAAYILGDQTGIGKGRVVAGAIRYAIRKGWTPVFVTEKPDLYGDMFRDMNDIGLQKMLGHEPRVFMTNTGESVPIDEEALAWKQEADQAREDGQPIPKRRGRFLTAGGKPAQEKSMLAIANGTSSFDVVFTTYDQMNTIKQQETDRRNFLRRVAPNAMLILDESHNAGGQGEKMFKTKGAPDRAEFVRDLVKNAAGVFYSSATFAKRPDVMDLYSRTDMGKAVDDPKMLPALIQRGGVPMQQIVATMLADAGQYMRRERSFEGVEYSVVPVPVDQKTYGQFSDAVRAVFEFDLAIEETRSEFMEDVLDQMGATQAKDAGVGGASANSIAFASIMHNIVNQMILSIKADQVATLAIEARKAGEKPVIALASTMESFISDYADDAGISINDGIDITFGDVLKKYLDRTLRITIKSAENEKSHVQIPVKSLPTSLQKMFAEAKSLIDEGDFSKMPVSPIDWIRHRLNKAGISVAEVTGRKSMIDYSSGNEPKYIVRPKKEIGPSGKRSSIAAFNRGDLDALILNRSGSTGVSMHASSKFKDQSLRHMIIAQAEGNIDTHLQMLGRVHRTGQVKTPRYSQIAAEIPAEARPTAVLMKKMASLNANTTGARGSVFMADSVDFMNEYGDKVVANIIMDEPEINDRLGSPLKENDKGIPVNEDAARRVTGRLVLLSPQDQTDLLNRIQDEYKTEIDRLDALGENALEAKTVDLQARVLDTTPLKDKAGEGPFLDSAQIEKVSVKAQGRAMSPAEIVEELSEFLGVSKPEGNEQASLATLERQGREWINKKVGDVRSRAVSWIAEDVAGVKSDDARAATKIRHDEQLRRWLATAQASAPGSRVTLEMGERQLHGIVLSVARTGKAKNPVALGAWVVTVAVPDSARTIAFPMSKLYPASATKSDDETGATIKPSMVPTSGLISQLNDARREGREERYMVTGNILAGYDQVHGKGQIVNFTMEDGSLRPGILMSRDFALNKFMDTRTVRLRSADQVAEFLEKAPIAEVRTSDKFVTLRLNRGNWTIETAAGRATGGRYYTDSRVRDALRGAEFQRSSGVMRVDLDKAGFKRVVEAIRSLGALFETTEAQDIAQDVVRASAPADAAPAAQTVAKTKPQSDTSKKIAEFGKSVDALKDQLGITTKKLNLDDDIQYAISGNAIATLRDQVAAMKGGSRVQVISEHAASYVADADLIVGTLEDAEIDIFDASADDLKAYLVALADLGQVIQTKTQQGYALSEEVQGLRDLLSDRMREYSFKISELETDAEWLGGRLTERLEEIDARIEEIAGPQPEETPEEEKALFERYDAVKEETPVDAGEHSPEASQLDVVEDEVTFAVALITPMQTQVEEFEARDIEEMDVAQLNAFRGEVERLEWTAYRASAWYKTLGEIADTGETKVYDVIDAINDDQIVPASERLEEAADDVTTKIDDARERLIDQQEMDAGQVIELADGTEAGPTWVKERIASWSKAISGLKQSNEALRAKSGTGINEEWKAATIARQEEEIARLSKDLEIYREGLADYEASNAQPLAAISSNVDISERAGEDAPFIDTPFGDLLFALSAKAASMKAEGTAAQWINKNEKADINWKAAYKAGVPSIAHVPAKQFKEKSSDASIKTISENLDLADYLKRQEGNVQGALAPEVAQAVQMYRDDPRGATAFIHNHIAQQRVRLLNEWRRYLTEVNEDYAKDPFWLDYVWSGITGKLNKESPTLPPPLLAGAVADVYLDVKNEPSMSTFDKLYEEAAVDSAVAQSSDDSRVDVGEEKTWVKVPQTQPNHSDFAKNVGLVRALSCKTWCTSQGMAEHYLPQGDFWVLTEGGQTKMAVRFRGKEVAEIQGPANNGRIPVQHIADVQALVDSDSVKLGQTAKKELDAAIMRVATAKELQDKIAANDIIGAWQALGASATPVFDGLRISGLDLERRNSLIADIDPGLIVRLVTNVTELEGDYVAYQRSPDEIDLPNLRLVDGDLRVYGKDTGRIQEVTGAVDWFTGRGATELSRASGGSFMRNDVGGRTGHSVISYVDVDGERLVVKLEPSYHALDASIDFNKQPGYVRRALHDFAEREGTGPFHQGSLQFAFDEALEERPKKPTLLQEARLWVLERKLKKRARELERVAGRIGRKNWLYSHRTKIGTVGHALGRAFEAGGLGITADTASLAIKNNASWITHPFLIRKARKYEAAKRAVERYMATLETKADNAGRKVRNDARKKSSVFEVLKKAGVKAIAFNDGATAAIYDPSVLIVTSKDGKPVEGKLRQAAIAKLLRQDEEAAPSFAVSGRAADVTPLSYSELEDAVHAGKTFVIPADRVAEQLKSIRPMLGIVSPDTHVGVLERVIPLPNDSIDPLKQKAKLRFATPDGKGLTLTFFLRQLDGMRAFAMPAALLGGRPGIFLLNVGAFEKLGPAAAGQIWHEGFHVLRGQGRITGDVWNRLLGHANKLRILDLKLNVVLRALGDMEPAPDVTVRQAYSRLYQNREDKVEVIRQEAITHMLELWHHGALSDADMTPVLDILDDIRAGRVSDNPRALEYAQMAEPAYAINAYHGSPHQFDRFSMDRVGTGEGAAAYGKGLYFAENEGVAKNYQEAMKARPDEVQAYANTALHFSNGDKKQALAYARDRASKDIRGDRRARWADAVELLETGKASEYGGQLYSVTINADKEDMIGWDTQLKKQDPKIAKAVSEILGFDARTWNGREAYNEIGMKLGRSLDAANAALLEKGIVGIHYLDQVSRGAGEGTSNFVIFDDKLIEINAVNGKPVKPEVRAEILDSRRDGFNSEPLDMSTDARRARAEAMGFDFDTPYYHGTGATFDAFSREFLGSNFNFGGTENGFFFSDKKAFAQQYVKSGGRLIETRLKMRNPMVFSVSDSMRREIEKVAQDKGKLAAAAHKVALNIVDKYALYEPEFTSIFDLAMKRGHDSVVIDFGKNSRFGRVVIVPDPTQIREAGAAFDPKESASPQLLAAISGNGALGMSPAARKARAEAQGFDTSKVWYHGTTADIANLNPAFAEEDGGVFFTDDPKLTDEYSDGEGGRVFPAYLRLTKTYVVSNQEWGLAEGLSPKQARAAGYNSYKIVGMDGANTMIVFASRDIRSVNAAFDPAENASNNILAAISGRTPVDRVMAWMEWAKDLKPKSLPEIKDRAGQSYSVDRRPFNGAITYTVRKGKKEVGSFYVRTGGSVLESVSVMNARVESNYQRRGIASAAYDAIEADLAPGGLSLYPQGSMSLSADGRAFWQSRDPGKLREMIDAERDPFRMYGQTIRPTIDANAQSDVITAINDAIEIVQRIAGQGVQVEFRSAIPTSEILARATDQSAEARARGMVGESSGGFYRRKTLHAEALIGLSTNAPGFDLKTSAGHESWHHVESVLATDAEYRLLTSESEMSRMRPLAAKELGIDVEDAVLRAMPDYEVRAYAFQRYRKLREDNITAPGLHIGVRRFFDRLIQVFRNVQNALRGQDYDSFESIFARARSGEMAQRAGTSAQPSQIELMVRKAVADVANSNRDTQHHVGAFIRQWLVQSSGDSITATDAYDTYTEWAEAAGIEPATVPEFSRGMSADRISSMKIAGAKRYIGLRVAEESERKAANPDEVFEKDAFEIARDVALGFSVRQSAERQIERLKSVVGEKPEFGRIANLEGMLAGMANDNAIDQQVYDNVLPMFDVMGNVIPENRPTPANRSGSVLGRRIRRTIARASDLSDRARVSLQDRALPIRRLAVERVENETGASVPVSLDTYVAEALYHGRAGERMNDLQDDIIEPLIEHLRQADITAEALGDYLYARHARERNAAILAIDPANDAGSGMTDQEADAILAAVRASGKHADMETAAGMVDRIIEDARKTLLKAGLIDRETFDTWSQKYAHYVPLRGFELGEDENPARIRSGRGFDIRGPESMQALGRRSKADNPVMYAVLQAQQAIVRAEKNRVNKTLYRMIQSNPNPAVWKIYRGEMRSRINPTTGFVEQYWVLPPFVRNDAVHGVKINGKQLWMELRHPALARAMRGVGSEIQGTVIGRALMGLTRTYASLLTSYNPEFMVSNFFRDVETAVFNSLDIEGGSKGVRAQIVKDALALKSIRGAFNALRGNAEGDYARFFDEYRLAGGKISFMEFNDVERIKKRINASLKAGKMRRALTAAARYVEDINSAVENGVRLSTYIAMRKNGVEKDRAAFTARELTVNFNRKGEWGPGINAAYLFFNASVQGTTRVVQAFARSKAVRYAVGSVFATGMALELFNFLMSGDDDDGENKYDKIPEWVRDRNIIIMNPFGSGDYIMIPMAYGYNLPYLAGQEMMRMGRGKSSPLEGAGRIAGATIDAFNPMGTNPLGAAGSFWQFVAPTMLDPGVQVLENRTWYGGPIQPTKYDQRKPDSENYFTSAPWWAVDTAKILNSMSGGNPARPGYVDVSPEVIEHYVEFAGGGVAKFVMNALNSGERLINGEEWLPEKAPFVRRLYGKSTSESRKREFFEAWDDVDRAQYEVKKLTKDGDRDAAQAAREKYAPELKVFGQMNAAKKTLKALREQHDKIEANTDLGRDEREARLNEIRDREKALIMRVLKSYRDAQKPAKPE